jgi:hypothetical protein
LLDELKQDSSEFAEPSTDINTQHFGEKDEPDYKPGYKIRSRLNDGTDQAQNQIGNSVPDEMQMKVSDQ